jgi:transaldolase
MNPIEKLHSLGQSLWYDNIQRGLLQNRAFQEMIARGEIRGMTSNPSIFNNAIAKSDEYDSAIVPMAWAGCTARQILDQLVLEDIRTAADLFLPLYKESQGGDGYISVEVSPTLAHDTAATLAEAHRLWELVNHPNVMVKIPATQEGIPAIRQAIADGININITLIFSLVFNLIKHQLLQ